MVLALSEYLPPPPPPKETPIPGFWSGVGGGNYSDVGVGEKCFDCAKEKKLFITYFTKMTLHYKTICLLKFYLLNEKNQ